MTPKDECWSKSTHLHGENQEEKDLSQGHKDQNSLHFPPLLHPVLLLCLISKCRLWLFIKNKDIHNQLAISPLFSHKHLKTFSSVSCPLLSSSQGETLTISLFLGHACCQHCLRCLPEPLLLSSSSCSNAVHLMLILKQSCVLIF